MRKLALASFLATLALALPARADTVTIDFESSGHPGAVPGADATNLYIAQGVRFPSRPTIERDEFLSTQVLQQAGPAGRACAPLEMEFSAASGVRVVRLRVINRHLRRYSVRAFGGRTEVDSFVFRPDFTGGPPHSPPRDWSDIVLRAAEGEPSITRIVADPPADCFDLMVVDDLVLETLRPVAPIDPVVDPATTMHLLAYEVSQGVMGRLTRPRGPAFGRPDTGLMALPEKKIPLLDGRHTGVRFFLDSTAGLQFLSPALAVDIRYRDGSRRRKTLLRENTEGGGFQIFARDPGATEADIRHSLVRRRARVDLSLDYVIPGPALVDAYRVDLALSDVRAGRPARRLATIRLDLEPSHTIGVNYVRMRGVAAAAGAGAAPPAQPSLSFLEQYLKDIFPVGQVRTREFPIPFTVDEGFGNCNSFLSAMAAAFEGLTAESEREFSASYWTNLYHAGASPSDCAAFAYYHSPSAYVVNIFDAPHEIGHTMGLNHVTNFHTEAGYEDWPYTHGSIGEVDESKGFDDGVFGLVLNVAPGSVGADLRDDWGTWQMGPIRPCRGSIVDGLPDCTPADFLLNHDFMSYGAGDRQPRWGAVASTRWTSDINYHRIARFLDECIALDPENRFWGPAPAETSYVSPNPRCRAAGEAGDGNGGVGDASDAVESVIVSGGFGPKGEIAGVQVLRKPVLPTALVMRPGDFVLTMLDANGGVLREVPFEPRVSPAEQKAPESRSFVVAIPYEPEVESIAVANEKEGLFFRRAASPNAPVVELLSPKPGDIWLTGPTDQKDPIGPPGDGGKGGGGQGPQGPVIRWKAEDLDQDALRVFIQLSPDLGKTWQPVASVDAALGELEVDVTRLGATEEALIYISVTDGVRSDAFVMEEPFRVVMP